MKLTDATRSLLVSLADRYETTDFIDGDPSVFMHRVKGDANREATAFVASVLSFGSRVQFLRRVEDIIDLADCDVDQWVRTGKFKRDFADHDGRCFYRFFTRGDMLRFFEAYRRLMNEYGTLGGYVGRMAGGDAYKAVVAICSWFAEHDGGGVVPKDATSACKRICMFLRWMVRKDSPVDLGLWADIIDRRTLIVPLDTHVVQEAIKLGLLKSPCASMSAARRLTAVLAEAFPEDPCRGDFALFGYGVDGVSSGGPA